MEWKRRKERKNRKREKSKWTGVESNLKWAHHVGGHVGQSAGYFANAFFEVLFHGVYVGRGVGRIAASGRVRGFFRLAVAEIVLRGNARRALKFIQTIFIFIILQIKIQLGCLEFALWKYFFVGNRMLTSDTFEFLPKYCSLEMALAFAKRFVASPFELTEEIDDVDEAPVLFTFVVVYLLFVDLNILQ